MKKIPYGMSNFKAMREEGYLYVDKTMYIEKIENMSGKYLFFIRPRRFGKSLFLSTLKHYYDINSKKDFDRLFGDLYIGKNPTKLRNSYMIFRLDFSGLDTSNKDRLEVSFKQNLIDAMCVFLDDYQNMFNDIEQIKQRIYKSPDIKSMVSQLINEVKKVGQKIYLIIDEYDHFANDIIAQGDNEFYKGIIRASGFVRDFYETLKIGTETVIDRMFITGISPVMLDDLTSGFNIALNVTMDLSLNEMLGFTEEEVVKVLEEIGVEKKDELVYHLRELYDGYKFNKNAKTRVYNPDMVLYFLAQFKSTGGYPEYLIDDNMKTDYERLNKLTMNERNRSLLEKIIKDEGIVAEIVTKFSFDRMYDEEYFVSLLFYMGLLTIERQEKTRLFLKIPNYVVKAMMWEYIENNLKKQHSIDLDLNELRKTIEKMAYEGKIEPYVEYISQNVLKTLSNRDMINFDEKYLKLILLTYLVNSKAYRPVSEKETAGGYIDIYLERDARIPDVKYEWLIELKYIKKGERNSIDRIIEEGLNQLKRYGESKGLQGRKDLKQALIIFIGKDEYRVIEIG